MEYHKDVAENYRAFAKENGLNTTALTDKEIWDLVESSRRASSAEEQDQWFLDDLKEALTHNNNCGCSECGGAR